MKNSKLSESEIIGILKEAEAGVPLEEVSRKYGISVRTYYKLRTKYAGMELPELKRLKYLEKENRKLKHMYADLSLDYRILKEVLEKKLDCQLIDEK